MLLILNQSPCAVRMDNADMHMCLCLCTAVAEMMDTCPFAEAYDILEALQAANRRRQAEGQAQDVDTAGEEMMRAFATILQSSFFQVLLLPWVGRQQHIIGLSQELKQGGSRQSMTSVCLPAGGPYASCWHGLLLMDVVRCTHTA